MPVVPQYQPGQVQQRGIFQQGLTTRASADDMGAAIGRGVQGLGQGLGQVADAMAQIKKLEDDARAKEADNEFAAWLRERQYGEGGFLTMEGRNAVEGRERFEAEIAERRRQFGEGLTPGAQQAFNRASTARLNSALDQSIVHTANQRKAWFRDASTQRLDTFAEDALAGFQNPETIAKNIAAGQAELRAMGQLQGWDADALAAREREFVSGVHKNVALRMAQENPIAADEYRRSVEGALSGSDRFDLERALSGPVLQARATGIAEEILRGAPAESQRAAPETGQGGDMEGALNDAGVPDAADVAAGSRATGIAPYVPGQVRGETAPTPKPNGNFDYMDAARSMIGMNENVDNAVIADFIRSFAGVEIDPAQTAWCAAFVNGILGFDGIQGTGKLNARSFLNFGNEVKGEPKIGDVVVFSRGDPNGWQGHVGFFKGYDANGNILVLGGNQSDSVSVASYSSERLLGVRRPSQGAVGERVPPNYSSQGLAHIEEQLAGIDDPQLRDAARQQIMRSVEAQNRIMRMQREEVQRGAESWVIANPGQTPDNLPIEMQQALGVSGMNTLWSWTDSVASRGQPSTDDVVLYELQTMYATDPEGFAQTDLFKYRDRLSDADWKTVTGWRQSALTDQRGAAEQGVNLTQAWSQASSALEAVGITTTGLKPKAKAEMAQREAQFNNSLAREMQAFQDQNGRAPNQVEVQSLINKLLLPTVISQPRRVFPGERTEDSLLFESGGLGEIGGGRSVALAVPYERIPASDRVEIEISLENEFGRKPSEKEVEAAYNAYLESTIRP